MKKILLLLAIAIVGFTSCEKETDYSISVTPSELTFEAEGGEQTIEVICSGKYQITDDADWLDVFYQPPTLKVCFNAEGKERSGTVIFSCGDKKAELIVKQKKDDSPIIQFEDKRFLDAIFNSYNYDAIASNYCDQNNDNQISEKEAAAVTELSLYCEYDISNMAEIKYFTALESLVCTGHQLTSLDLSNNTALKKLNCWRNQLTTLDVSKNTALKYLDCGNNQLTSLDVRNNTALESLYCYNNKLTFLDVSNNTALESLYCDSNQLTTLDVSKNTALKYLDCYSNKLTSLDVRNNTALRDLDCDSNQLTFLNLGKNTALEFLNCDNNPLTKLILYKKHTITPEPEVKYGDIIEYVE